MAAMAGCFRRWEPRLQAKKYVRALMSDLPRKNCWTIAEHAGDATPGKMQDLLERAKWDTMAAMAAVRGFVCEHLDDGDAVAILDESGQEKKGTATVGVKRQYVPIRGVRGPGLQRDQHRVLQFRRQGRACFGGRPPVSAPRMGHRPRPPHPRPGAPGGGVRDQTAAGPPDP